ncbi:hypothetical protein QRN89_22700 [Streptomyces chengbuensis]|nr:hypothetical protein [Streptomyces sp. HUAS CB01]WJY52367.1 hypothetical protein QRN89_22700 [Streptomyces sp. HUAS CB01]
MSAYSNDLDGRSGGAPTRAGDPFTGGTGGDGRAGSSGRAGRGPGNALFVSTWLAVILGAATGGSTAAILPYESALGLGMA